MTNENSIITQTRYWVKNVVIQFYFCPFAGREFDDDNLRFQLCESTRVEDALQALIDECFFLDQHTKLNTSLLILAQTGREFGDYLKIVEMAEKLLRKQGYEGEYQIASFHPDYQFADAPKNDPANYTNRSPYPMIHIIRESSLEKALANFPHPESIPQKNIEVARGLGQKKLQSILDLCKNLTTPKS
jgi:hypothetical protein